MVRDTILVTKNPISKLRWVTGAAELCRPVALFRPFHGSKALIVEPRSNHAHVPPYFITIIKIILIYNENTYYIYIYIHIRVYIEIERYQVAIANCIFWRSNLTRYVPGKISSRYAKSK